MKEIIFDVMIGKVKEVNMKADDDITLTIEPLLYRENNVITDKDVFNAKCDMKKKEDIDYIKEEMTVGKYVYLNGYINNDEMHIIGGYKLYSHEIEELASFYKIDC